jgi:ornithine carbamoyltransferase
MRHLLNITDLTAEELVQVLHLAERTDLRPVLAGVGVALIFEKPSNRTRQSMEMAVVQLGGHPVYTRGEEVGFDVRESVEDVTRVMAGYHAMLAARVFDHSVVDRMAAVTTVPIVNMLSDYSHPLQGLADVLTMQQVHGPLAGHTVAYVGDYNNVARSLAEASVLLGADVSLGCPVGYQASDVELERLNLLGDGRVAQSHRASDAVDGAIAVHTDTWTSMGQEAEKDDRKQAFEGYTVTDQMMARAAPGAGFYHCLPAYRGYEVAADVIDGPQSFVFQQAHNRMHVARGALAFLMGVR